MVPWREGRKRLLRCNGYRCCRSLLRHSIIGKSLLGCGGCCTAQSRKCAETTKARLSFPLAFETMGPVNRAGQDFTSERGHRISTTAEDRTKFASFFNVFLLFVSISMPFVLLIRSLLATFSQITRSTPENLLHAFNNF
jgi:hypothetical protein